jgi:AAA domain
MTAEAFVSIFESDAALRDALRVAGYDVAQIPVDDYEEVLRSGRMPPRAATGVKTGDPTIPAPRLFRPAAHSTSTPAHRNGAAPENEPTFDLVDLRTRTVRAVKWIEEPYLARGELHILQGHGGVGKGSMTMLWAAETSRRKEFALIVSAEDDLDSSVYPRLIAAGADFDYIRVLQVRRGELEDALVIPDDLAWLEHVIDENDARLLVVDPLLTHVTGKTDSYKDHEVKRALTPLSSLAQRTGCTIVGVHHFRKDTSAGAKLSGQGSSAFYTTARVTLAMARGDDDLHVLEVTKSNIGPEGAGQNLRLRIVEIPAEDGDTAKAPLLERDGDATQTVDELLAKPKRESQSGKARELILDILENEGEQESDGLDARVAKETGLAAGTVRNQRTALAKDGLIKNVPAKDEHGTVVAWKVTRSQAART